MSSQKSTPRKNVVGLDEDGNEIVEPVESDEELRARDDGSVEEEGQAEDDESVSPTPLMQKSEDPDFDSEGKPGEKYFLPGPIQRPRGPRKSHEKSAAQDTSSPADTDDKGMNASEPTDQSQKSIQIDEMYRGLERRRRDAGVPRIEGLEYHQLGELYSKTLNDCKRLTAANVDLETRLESDALELESLKESLKAAKTATNAFWERTETAEKELAIQHETSREISSRNVELEAKNKVLNKETTQLRDTEQKLWLLNQSGVNQLVLLKDEIHRKDKTIRKQKEDMETLVIIKDEKVRVKPVEELLGLNRKLTDENLAMRQEMEAIRGQLDILDKHQEGLANDIWKNDSAPLLTHDGDEASVEERWNLDMGERRSSRQSSSSSPALTNGSTYSSPSLGSFQSGQGSGDSPGLTNGSTYSSPSVESPPLAGSTRPISLNSTLEEMMQNCRRSASGGLFTKSNSSEQTPSRDSLRPRGLDIDTLTHRLADEVEPSIDEDGPIQPAEAREFASFDEVKAYSSSAEHLLSTAQPEPLQTSPASSSVQVSTGEGVSKAPEDANTGAHTDPATTDGQVQKLPYMDIEGEPIPREVFEAVKPVTIVDEGMRLPSTTYVGVGTQVSPTQTKDDGTQTDSIDDNDSEPLDATKRGNSTSKARPSAFGWWPSSSLTDAILRIIEIFAGDRNVDQSKTHDSGIQADAVLKSESSSLLVGNKQPQSLSFNRHVFSISSKFRNTPATGTVSSAQHTCKLPSRCKKESEQRARTSDANNGYRPDQSHDEELVTGNKIKGSTPWWWYAVLGAMIMVVLTHAFFEEKRFWRNANELTRKAVVSMRDERWGSRWVEQIEYTIDDKLGLDYTGFC